jgi:glucose-1-phosphate cytidylyltransferase
MKVVILAGGLGTRLMEETESRPKPMVEIGGKPILWHIMKIYESYGFNEFVICLGYKSQMIKEYFLNYYLYNSDITVELEKNKVDVHFNNSESFKVTLVDTGLTTNTAGRIKKIQKSSTRNNGNKKSSSKRRTRTTSKTRL